MRLSERDQMIDALATDRANETLSIRVLAWRLGRSRSIPYPHGMQTPLERVAVRTVAITDQIFRRAVPWKRFGDLASNPFSGGMRCDINRDDQSPVDRNNDQRKERAQIGRRNNEQIERGNSLLSVPKRSSGLTR